MIELANIVNKKKCNIGHYMKMIFGSIVCTVLISFSAANASMFPVYTPYDNGEAFRSGFNNAYNDALSRRMQQQQLRTQQLQNELLQNELMERRRELASSEHSKYQDDEMTDEPNKLMIFAQNEENTYLGCINCPPDMEDSVYNHHRNAYGNKTAKNSIFNTNSPFGSKNSNLSACNPHAIHPPLIFDERGVLHGALSLNMKLRTSIKDPIVLKWLKKQICIK